MEFSEVREKVKKDARSQKGRTLTQNSSPIHRPEVGSADWQTT
jgi:hypothetical protein